MTPFLSGFADELVKISSSGDVPLQDVFREAKKETKAQPSRDRALSSLRGSGTPVSRDYLASMLIGGASAPLISILGKKISRHMGNKDVRRALAATRSSKKRKAIMAELHTGPTIGRSAPGAPLGKRPLLTHGELASDAAKGAVAGGAIQMIRDYFAGSSPTSRKDS